MFVYDDDDERAGEVYAAFVRKLINWLTVKTGEGDLFEIDTALRPNGNSGLLVTSFDAYANYQQQRGSNTAWTWEHQAMTRARFVLGGVTPAAARLAAARFDAVREAVITAAARRQRRCAQKSSPCATRCAPAHPVKAGDQFDVKHSPGGMVDAEFAVQFLVLSQVGAAPGTGCTTWAISPCCSAPKLAGLLPAAWARPPPAPTANCATCSTGRA